MLAVEALIAIISLNSALSEHRLLSNDPTNIWLGMLDIYLFIWFSIAAIDSFYNLEEKTNDLA